MRRVERGRVGCDDVRCVVVWGGIYLLRSCMRRKAVLEWSGWMVGRAAKIAVWKLWMGDCGWFKRILGIEKSCGGGARAQKNRSVGGIL